MVKQWQRGKGGDALRVCQKGLQCGEPSLLCLIAPQILSGETDHRAIGDTGGAAARPSGRIPR